MMVRWKSGWAPASARALPRPRVSGFTLVEMLVALVIFALLAGAGVGLLRGSVGTQEAVAGKLADLAASERLRVLLASDLAQALDRPSRDAGGGMRPAFVGDEQGLRLVRGGWTDANGHAALQAVAWRVVAASLTRQGSPAVDGELDGTAASLLGRVTRAAFRYRAKSGEWRRAWAPVATEPPLPAAVELTVLRSGEAAWRMVLALPPVPGPPSPLDPGATQESGEADDGSDAADLARSAGAAT